MKVEKKTERHTRWNLWSEVPDIKRILYYTRNSSWIVTVNYQFPFVESITTMYYTAGECPVLTATVFALCLL